MTLTADTPANRYRRGLVRGLAAVLRAHCPRFRRTTEEEPPSTDDALVRALCHDMRSPLASLEATLGSLGRTPEHAAELLALARAQTAHLSSMLRTADATGGALRRAGRRVLRDVVQAAMAASGLPRTQLTAQLVGDVGDVPVEDARVQRILTNLLENAHRHGGGAPVGLRASRRRGWVELALTQGGVPAHRVVGHLRTTRPPVDLTGLGLWSVQRQTRELGGRVVWDDDGVAFTLTVQLPDR
ncbi:ATP-binding protein [Blastococcus deserti]|uniref:histidine kinase n=1 Tax=Blastococcus deserti TaxID=2259033 RepID=A0ABW4XB35_9ACTN